MMDNTNIKIAVMMRAMDQDSGFRAYVMDLVENILSLDQENRYLLLYRKTKWLGRFSSCRNVKEIYLWAPHKLAWDQVAVPYRAWREGADVIFNPKFSVPLFSHCPVAMGLQEPGWWTWSQHYEWIDARYNRIMLPLFVRKASRIFPMSNFILRENQRVLDIPLEKTTVAYAAPGKHFRKIEDPAERERIRTKYHLPDRFILSVTRVDHPGIERSRSFHGGKNPETALRAFLQCRNGISQKMVFAGRRVRDYLLHKGFDAADFHDVLFLDFVPHEDLPSVFNLADLFINTSFYEGFGITVVEAMACGCPVLASKRGACPEVTGGSAMLADPDDPADFAEKMLLVLKNDELRKELAREGLERASFFDMRRTAKRTLEGLVEAARKDHQSTIPQSDLYRKSM